MSHVLLLLFTFKILSIYRRLSDSFILQVGLQQSPFFLVTTFLILDCVILVSFFLRGWLLGLLKALDDKFVVEVCNGVVEDNVGKEREDKGYRQVSKEH